MSANSSRPGRSSRSRDVAFLSLRHSTSHWVDRPSVDVGPTDSKRKVTTPVVVSLAATATVCTNAGPDDQPFEEQHALACIALGKEIYTWHPKGQGRSPLAAALGNLPLRGAVTTRNWNTVQRLVEMLDDG